MTENTKPKSGNLVPFRRVEVLANEMSDDALLAACASGDSAALGALYDRLSCHLWRFLSRMTGGEIDELEDLMQATFVAVQASAASFKGIASVRTWVFAIAANLTNRHLRDAVRRRSASDRFAKLPVPPVQRPDDSLEQQQLLARMREALSALPHDLRVSLVMCDLEDISGREAASVLAIPEGTLYRRVHDARRELRALVEEAAPSTSVDVTATRRRSPAADATTVRDARGTTCTATIKASDFNIRSTSQRQEGSRDHQSGAETYFPRDRLAEHDCCENDGEGEAQLIDRRDTRGRRHLKGLEIRKPRDTSSNA